MPQLKKHKSSSHARDARRSRSRNTTPVSTSTAGTSVVLDAAVSAYLHMPLSHISVVAETSLEEIMNHSSSNGSSNGGGAGAIPAVGQLGWMADRTSTQIVALIKQRQQAADRGVAELGKKNKTLGLDDDGDRKGARGTSEEHRPPAIGAHGLARQDGGDVKERDRSSSLSSPSSNGPPSAKLPPPDAKATATTGSGAATTTAAAAASPSDSETSQQPPPAPAVPQYQIFGPDPTKFEDPTIYHIRDVLDDMTDDEKRDVLNVQVFPESDLYEKTPGTPPDRDFSNAKPQNQVAFTTFLNFIDPYIRPLTEEDLQFLRERGDRVGPFVMPRRGPRHYKDIWAEEDGIAVGTDAHTNAAASMHSHEPHGSMDDMDDDVAEAPADISTGPTLARLLSLIRPSPSVATTTAATTNGNTGTGAGDDDSAMDLDDPTAAEGNNGDPPPGTVATHMREADGANYRAPAPPPSAPLDYSSLEDRIKTELRYVGFLDDDDEPEYDKHDDDDVAARLRYLQEELRRVTILNGARKARLLELSESRMAAQEYSTIADDLDQQLSLAYQKRSKNVKQKKGVKRPGTAAAAAAAALAAANAGAARHSIGEPLKSLKDRREAWQDMIGPVVNYGRAILPKETIFDAENMKRLSADEERGMGEAVEE